ncbi:MAG TPA: hypothetical protein ENH10_03560 [Bacteroidetes bacterium]|nr:phosphate acetyltransferase [bacterium BMS3Bbin04]HDO65094.1 hypothetical protein [Bacteroidota bacterium]HEX04219.1 hypothetical protein [Bacteroidota bacterium]
MNKVPKDIRELVSRLDKSTGSKPPTLCVVANSWNHYLKAGLMAVKRRWATLRIICDETVMKPYLDQGMIPDRDVSVHHVSDSNAQLALLRDWCVEKEVDVLLPGDLSQGQLYHLLSNPYHRQSLEDGASRACLVSVPGYPRIFAIVGPVNPENPLFNQMVLHMKNGYHLAAGLGVERPKIALLSALDRVGIDDLHTYNCKCLVSQNQLEQIPGMDLEGPMSFDTAIDPATVEYLGWKGPVAGQADILIVDNQQTRSILALTLKIFGKAQTARVGLGGRIPLAYLLEDATDVDVENTLAAAINLAPYMRKADPLDWLTEPDPIDYAW